VCAVIARAARGSVRDALGTLDQLAAFGEQLCMSDALDVLGAVDRRVLAQIVDAAAAEDVPAALRAAEAVLFGGTDVEDFADQLGQYLRDLLVACYCGPEDPMLAGAAADAETLARQSGQFSPDQLTYMIQLLREAKLRARRDTTGRVALELALIKMCRLAELVPLSQALGELREGRAAPPARNPGSSAEPTRTAPSGVGALRRMGQRLKAGRRGRAPDGGGQKPPEGVDEVKYRQILACAEDPDAAREALRQEGLRKAFVEADQALGLDPVRLERVSPPKEAPEAEGESEQ
ncbi:MAG: hypothetical protein ACYS1C_12560, partial [Planctomycetota bacterium]|jgi:DNA polymerase-3 subunit gamma/tau